MTSVVCACSTARHVGSRVGWLHSWDNLRTTQFAPRCTRSVWYKDCMMQNNARHCKVSSPQILDLGWRLLLHEVPGSCARWTLGCFVFGNQQNTVYESKLSYLTSWNKNRRNSSIYIPSSHINRLSLFPLYWTHLRHPELSQRHVTCSKQCLSFQNTPEHLHNFVRSLWALFRYMQQYHNANASDVDSFSTHWDGTRGYKKVED